MNDSAPRRHLHLAGAVRGARAVVPIVPGAWRSAWSTASSPGSVASALLEIGLMSMLVFAGASQFLALELWGDPLPLAALVLGVLVINLRHLLMGPALLPWLGKISRPRAYASLYFMTDESWGLSVADLRRGGRDAAFLIGAGFTLFVFWGTFTVSGRAAGDLSYLIRDWGLAYLTAAFFVALLAGFWRGNGDWLPWLAAGGIAMAAKWLLPGTWYIILGALTGSLLGACRDRR